MTKQEFYKKQNERTKANYDKVTILLPKGAKEYFKEQARLRGISVSSLFFDCTYEFLKNQ